MRSFKHGARVVVAAAIVAGVVLGAVVLAEAPQPAGNTSSVAGLETLAGHIAALEARKDELNAEAYRRLMPLAQLKLEIAQLLQSEGSTWNRTQVERETRAGEDALARLERGEAPTLAQQRGRRNDWAYVSQTDGSIQPWYIFIPKRYDPQAPAPLVVFLHGWVPSTSKADPWVPGETALAVADRHDALFLVPHGRRNSDFQGVGEVDVLATIDEARRYYNVDPERIYLMGTSMGGFGTWLIALHYPHLFAAIAPVSGQTDYFVWYDYDRERLAPWKRDMVAMFNPFDLAENALNVPAYCQHGALDNLVPTVHSRIMVERLKQLGYDVEYYEEKGTGHYIYWDDDCYERALGFLLKHKLNRFAKHVVYQTYTLKYNRAYWVTIDDLQEWGPPARVEAQVAEDGAVSITTTNVAALTLDLAPDLIGEGAQARIVVNGQPQDAEVPADHLVHWRLAPAGEDGLQKTHDLCGPARDAFNTPFIVVYGTAGEDQRDTENTERAIQFIREWKAFADGEPLMKADADVTPEDVQTKNLVLFGRPSDNSCLGGIADRLPIKMDNTGFDVGGKRFEGEKLGLWMVYPNPDNPARYVLVVSGYPWGEFVGDAHRYDLIPDFIIFDDHKEPDPTLSPGPHRMEIPTNHALCAGFFDDRWQLSDRLTYLAQP